MQLAISVLELNNVLQPMKSIKIEALVLDKVIRAAVKTLEP